MGPRERGAVSRAPVAVPVRKRPAATVAAAATAHPFAGWPVGRPPVAGRGRSETGPVVSCSFLFLRARVPVPGPAAARPALRGGDGGGGSWAGAPRPRFAGAGGVRRRPRVLPVARPGASPAGRQQRGQ